MPLLELNQSSNPFLNDPRVSQYAVQRRHELMWVICFYGVFIYLVAQLLLITDNFGNVLNFQQNQIWHHILVLNKLELKLEIKWVFVHIQISHFLFHIWISLLILGRAVILIRYIFYHSIRGGERMGRRGHLLFILFFHIIHFLFLLKLWGLSHAKSFILGVALVMISEFLGYSEVECDLVGVREHPSLIHDGLMLANDDFL